MQVTVSVSPVIDTYISILMSRRIDGAIRVRITYKNGHDITRTVDVVSQTDSFYFSTLMYLVGKTLGLGGGSDDYYADDILRILIKPSNPNWKTLVSIIMGYANDK